jgi:hypothetical protein
MRIGLTEYKKGDRIRFFGDWSNLSLASSDETFQKGIGSRR